MLDYDAQSVGVDCAGGPAGKPILYVSIAVGNLFKRLQNYMYALLRWLKEQFIKADKDKTGSLDFKQVLDLLDRVNIKLSRRNAKQLFEVCTWTVRCVITDQ